MSKVEIAKGEPRIMAHLVAGYPDDSGAFAAARALVEGGADYLEIQFPFSDPSADGPVIQNACAESLANGFTVGKGFGFVAALVLESRLPVFIMSYASLVFARGIDRFCADAKAAGAAGLIVPDLCPGSDEGLYRIGARYGLEIVPVIAPGVDRRRLDEILLYNNAYIYVALRTGITGGKTEIGRENIDLLTAASSSGAKILAGFGISERLQVLAMGSFVHAAVIGSAFVRVIAQESRNGTAAICRGVYTKLQELLGE